MPVVTPELRYQLFWIGYALIALLAARIWLVNPIVRAIERLGGCR